MPDAESLRFLYTIETQLASGNQKFLQGINKSFVTTSQKDPKNLHMLKFTISQQPSASS
jgi:hypothetical protein